MSVLVILKFWCCLPKSVNPDPLLQFLTELGQNVDCLILVERQENRTLSVHLLLELFENNNLEIPGKEWESLNDSECDLSIFQVENLT